MATNLALGDNLIESARRAGGHKAKNRRSPQPSPNTPNAASSFGF
jgi:hypothetical protein